MTPYIILLIFMILITIIQSKEIVLSKFMLLGAFLGFQGWSGTFQGLTHTWFISYILLCYLITPILNRIKVFNNTDNYKKTLIAFILFAIVLQLSISFNVLKEYPSSSSTGYDIELNFTGNRTFTIFTSKGKAFEQVLNVIKNDEDLSKNDEEVIKIEENLTKNDEEK